jgi:hypothetical protein
LDEKLNNYETQKYCSFFLSFVPKIAGFYADFQTVEKYRTKKLETFHFYFDNYELFPAFSIVLKKATLLLFLSYIEFLPFIILVLFVDKQVNPVQNSKRINISFI